VSDFKVGDRVKILPGIATPFVGMEGIIDEIQPHDEGIETMDRHVVVFERREKLAFYGVELVLVRAAKAPTVT
jgi:transcription antitermination factor NusG